MNNTLEAIRNAVLSAPAVGGIRIVGIDGPSGSGKSAWAGKLAQIAGSYGTLPRCLDRLPS